MAARVSRRPLPAGFGTVWLAVAVDAIGFGIVIPILPLYADELHASPTVIGLLLASFSLAQFVGAPRWGRLSDRFGRKPALVTSLAGTAVGALVTAAAPNVGWLLVGRIVDGASGGSLSVAQAAAGDVATSSGERTRLLGLLGAAFGIGFVAGPAIGGLAALAGPRVPFVVAALLAAANAALALRRVPETRPHPTRDGVTAVVRSRHSRTIEGRRAFLVVAFLSTAAFGAFEATFALLGARRLGLTIAGTSVVFVGAGVLVALANARLVEPVARRLGDVGALRLGLVLDAAGLAALAGVRSLPALAVAITVLAVGHGLALPALASAVSARVAPEHRGAALGAQQAAASLARVVGPALAGSTFGLVGPSVAFTGAAALAAAAAVTPLARRAGRSFDQRHPAVELAA